jgi:DNA-binding transcriptional MerR regulator
MRSGELARRLRVSDTTVRDWCSQYGDLLSPQGRGAKPGAPRSFTDRDALILASVNLLRLEGRDHDDILLELQSGPIVNEIPDLPSAEEQRARDTMELVPGDAARRLYEQLKVESEGHQSALAVIKEMQDRERDLLREIGELKARAGLVEEKDSVIGRLDKQIEANTQRSDQEIAALKAELEAIRKQLDDERTRKRGWFG